MSHVAGPFALSILIHFTCESSLFGLTKFYGNIDCANELVILPISNEVEDQILDLPVN